MKLAFLKISTVVVLIAMLVSMKSDNGRKDMLCQTWVQFAFKKNGAISAGAIDNSMAKTCTFNPDGSYEESMYNNALKISGHYFLNSDQTKFDLQLEVMNGQTLPVSSDGTKHYNTIILKLTKDTLIYGNEAYYGETRVYGHDDWYFVRKH